MTLVKFNRNRNFPSIFEDWDRFTNAFWPAELSHAAMPKVNVLENDKEFRLEVSAPGRSKEDFNLAIDSNVLTISSEKESKKEETNDKFSRREFSISRFERSFNLPENVDAEKIEASYRDGILTITLPKLEQKTKSQKVIKIA